MITTTNYNPQNLYIGSLQEKKLRDGKKCQNIPILYDGRKALVHLRGRFQIRSVYLILQVDDDNRKLFEDFENLLICFLENYPGEPWSSISEDISLIKKETVYLKIYKKDGEMCPKDGKEYKKPIHNPESLIGENIEGEVVFSIANIFVGKNEKGEYFPQSIVSVAEEILVKYVMDKSYFKEYPVGEDDEILEWD